MAGPMGAPGPNQVATAIAAERLSMDLRDPVTSFGEMSVSELTPRVQIDPIFGLLTGTDHEVFTATGGAVSVADSMFVCTTGTSVGGFGVVRSRRLIRYRPGQGVLARFGLLVDEANATALSLQFGGMFTSTDGVWVGYSGADFGCTRRIGGALEIQTLTLSAAASGAENIDIVLNGTTFATSVTSGTVEQNAAEIVSNGTFTGWTVQNVGATVIFRQTSAAVQGGAFSFTNTTGGGTCAGTLAQNQAGAANDDSTGFVAQTAWNVDRLDGSGGTLNPSGETLDKSKIQTWQIVFPWHGAGTIRVQWYSPTQARFVTVHQYEYGNSAVVPNQKQPIYRIGYTAASLGSTTNITVKGTAMLGAVEGQYQPLRTVFATDGELSASATEAHLLSIRPAIEFNDLVNQREFVLKRLNVLIDQTNRRAGRVKMYRNATLTGDIEWAYVDDGVSSAHVAQGASVTGFSGGIELLSEGVTTDTPLNEHVEDLDIRLVPGETLTITFELVSNTADVRGSLTWDED